MEKRNCVLLIDDDQITNYINIRLLKKLDAFKDVYNFLSAKDGFNFVKEYSNCNDNNCPDLILIDLNMPGMGGVEFLEMINQEKLNKSNSIIALLSASIDTSEMNKIKKKFEVKFISKPLTLEKLNEILSGD